MRRILAVTIVLTSLSVFAEPYQLSIPKTNQSSKNLKQYPQQPPILVQVVPASRTQDEIEHESKIEEKKAEQDHQLVMLTGDLAQYTKWLFFATTALAVITGGLVIVGFFQMRDTKNSIKAAEKSAAAAEESIRLAREDFINTHRPRIILREAYAVRDNGHPLKVSYVLANIGGTTTTIQWSKLRLGHEPNGGHKRGPECENMLDMKNVIIVPGEHFASEFISSDAGETWGNNYEFDRATWGIYFSGHVAYEDDTGMIRHMAFYRRYDEGTGRFIPIDDPQLEYSDERN